MINDKEDDAVDESNEEAEVGSGGLLLECDDGLRNESDDEGDKERRCAESVGEDDDAAWLAPKNGTSERKEFDMSDTGPDEGAN